MHWPTRADAGIAQLQEFDHHRAGGSDQRPDRRGAGEFQKFLAGGSLGADALTGLRTAGEIAAGTALTAVILFFFLKDGEKIRAFLVGFLPPSHQDTAHLAADRSIIVLGGYVRGTLIVAAMDAVIVLTGLLILRAPLAVPLAAVVFLAASSLSSEPRPPEAWRFWSALVENGPVPALVVLIILVPPTSLNTTSCNRFSWAASCRIHGLVIILALAAGATLAGVVGALLAVPLTAVGWTIYKTVARRDVPRQGTVTD